MDSSTAPAASQDTASLIKRLAGPSTGKAGLAKDQTDINRIIAEASKGSKFYENEKKKDKDLTVKISKILKQRDEAINDVDMNKVEATVDHILAELESQRDLSQSIVHVDMDAFFANVELLHDPTLKGKPFGVGHGVLTTASYDARKFGVRSGMPTFIAKKLCPELILVKNTFSRYSDMSKKVMSIFQQYDPNMLIAGCDEGYLNITSYCEEHGLTPDECVQEMRDKVFEHTKLTASAGIAPNKMLAKICSDKNKPNGQFHLPFERDAIKAFMRDLSIRKVPGIGRVNERLLDSIGIKTCGDIYTHRGVISLMDKQFGLRFLLRTYLGIASNVVEPSLREERKSIGAERTFHSLSNKDKILQKLDEVAQELESDMNSSGWAGKTVTLKFKLDTYQVFTRAKSFDRWITKKDDLLATGKELLAPEFPVTLRLIGLRVTKLKDLRASSDPTTGIKRFFGQAKYTPNKKRKLDDPEEATAVDDGLDAHGWEETMPGYHEDNEDDIQPEGNSDNDMETESTTRPFAGTRPPVSAPARSHETKPISSSNSSSSKNRKPHSTSAQTGPSRVPKPERSIVAEYECPVCSKKLETDNDGFNAHIDFCLSRGAIWEAQGKASGSTRRTASDLKKPKVEAKTWNWGPVKDKDKGKRKLKETG